MSILVFLLVFLRVFLRVFFFAAPLLVLVTTTPTYNSLCFNPCEFSPHLMSWFKIMKKKQNKDRKRHSEALDQEARVGSFSAKDIENIFNNSKVIDSGIACSLDDNAMDSDLNNYGIQPLLPFNAGEFFIENYRQQFRSATTLLSKSASELEKPVFREISNVYAGLHPFRDSGLDIDEYTDEQTLSDSFIAVMAAHLPLEQIVKKMKVIEGLKQRMSYSIDLYEVAEPERIFDEAFDFCVIVLQHRASDVHTIAEAVGNYNIRAKMRDVIDSWPKPKEPKDEFIHLLNENKITLYINSAKNSLNALWIRLWNRPMD